MTTPITRFNEQNWFLSNFSPAKIMVDGVEYPSLEHAFQASKTFNQLQRSVIQNMKDPNHARRYGRRIALRPGWDEMRNDVMLRLLRQKFSDPVLRKRLLDTGDVELVEGNHWGDTYWGVCNCKGENMLGKLLMKVREEIREA